MAFHVQRHLSVPLSTAEFNSGLRSRFIERDGMFFLSRQANEYEAKRMGTSALKQLDLFVFDEASAILWLRQELSARPRSLQDLTPLFMKEIQGWAGHERNTGVARSFKTEFPRIRRYR